MNYLCLCIVWAFVSLYRMKLSSSTQHMSLSLFQYSYHVFVYCILYLYEAFVSLYLYEVFVSLYKVQYSLYCGLHVFVYSTTSIVAFVPLHSTRVVSSYTISCTCMRPLCLPILVLVLCLCIPYLVLIWGLCIVNLRMPACCVCMKPSLAALVVKFEICSGKNDDIMSTLPVQSLFVPTSSSLLPEYWIIRETLTS